MPSRRKDTTSAKAIARRIKDGRGAGRGINYLPWYYVTDFPSWGTSSVMTGWNGQEHHWVSFGERKTCHCYAWRPDRVLEILGQFPIHPREETVRIAQMMGVRHPPGLITIDFLLKVLNSDWTTRYVARDVKELKELADQSVLVNLSIAMIAMELRGIEWGLVISDHDDFPNAEYEAVDWAFKAHDLKSALALGPDKVWEVGRKLNSVIAAAKGTVVLRRICIDSDRTYGFAKGTSMKVARFLVANKAWALDMTREICTSKPMKIDIDKFQSTMEQLCGHLDRA